MDKEKFKEIPIGTGRESESKERLPAVNIDNKVIWVNNEIRAPLKLERGESTDLARFLTLKPERERRVFNLEIAEEHGRSALLGRVVFQDEQGRFYRDLDLKGMGWVEQARNKDGKVIGLKVGKIEPTADGTSWGIFDLEDAEKTMKITEKFLKTGVRTERYLAIIKLKKIIDERGQKIPIKEARKKNLIFRNEKPVVVLRAFGTKSRLNEADTEKLEDARRLVFQERGIKQENFSWQDYIKWFAETAGKNLGLIHREGWWHGCLTYGNITLDCRFVDWDSAASFRAHGWKNEDDAIEKEYEHLKQKIVGSNRIPSLLARVNKYTDEKFNEVQKKEFQDIFDEAYKKALGRIPKFLAEKKEK